MFIGHAVRIPGSGGHGPPLVIESPGTGGGDVFDPSAPGVDEPPSPTSWEQVAGTWTVDGSTKKLKVQTTTDHRRILFLPFGPAAKMVTEVDLDFPSNTSIGTGVIGLWDDDADKGYLFQVLYTGVGTATVQLYRRTPGTWTLINEKTGLALDPDTMYHLKAYFTGVTQRCWISDVLRINSSDMYFADTGLVGRTGLRGGGSNAAFTNSYDNWKVYADNFVTVRGLRAGGAIRVGGKSSPVVF